MNQTTTEAGMEQNPMLGGRAKSKIMSNMQNAWVSAGLNPDNYSAAVGDAMNEYLTDEAKSIIKELRKRQESLYEKFDFCKQHNFNLEAQSFRSLEDEVRRICQMLENHFDTGYVSAS